MKLSIELPFFPGFYESDLYCSDTAYWAIEDHVSDLKYEGREDVSADDFDFDDDSFRRDAINAFVDIWSSYAPDDVVDKVELDEMTSPREYNFANDRLFAWITFKDNWEDVVRSFMSKNADWLRDRIKKDWSSYDGFISFMSNNFDRTGHDGQDKYSDDNDSWYYHIFEKKDERYIGIMIGYMMYFENKDVRGDIVMGVIEDICLADYVYEIKK